MLEHVTELALVVALFGAGLAVKQQIARSSLVLVLVLSVIVMPLTILAIAAHGMTAMGSPLAAAILLGAVLDPQRGAVAARCGRRELSSSGGVEPRAFAWRGPRQGESASAGVLRAPGHRAALPRKLARGRAPHYERDASTATS